MKQYRSYLWILIAVLAMGLAVSACNKGGGNERNDDFVSGPSYVPDAPVASNPAPAPAPAPGVVGGRDGVAVETLSSNFADGRCTDLSLPEFAGVTELVEIARVTNNTGGKHELYDKTALYQTRRATCDAHADNPAGPDVTDPMVTGGNIPNGESREWTHRFVVPNNFCGSMQFDNDARNGDVAVSTLSGGAGGYVINSGRDCPDCEFYELQVIVTGEGLTRNVKVLFDHPKANKKATVNYGDGSAEEVYNRNETKQHTFPYGTYTVKVRLEDQELPEPCLASTEVTTEKPCQVEWIELKPEITYGEWGECTSAEDDFTASTVKPQECQQTRTVRTVIKEQNSCTEEVRVKSDTTDTESQPCECPCVEEWIPQEPVRENVGEWSECSADRIRGLTNNTPPPEHTKCEGWMYRTYDEVIYEVNSCTQKVREASRTQRTEESPCGYECLADLCHTQNDKWCGWLGCKPHWYIGATKKWQCQNVPPASAGHYPNHFGHNQHDDFFGQCNTEKCYNIVN